MGSSNFNPLTPPNTYRNPDNPYYWKNKMPFAGYWQQDVHYRIKAELDDSSDKVSGTLELSYWNNSPDTLNVLYFHLYQNAFQPESYLDKLNLENKNQPVYGRNGRKKLGSIAENIKVNDQPVETFLDNTILQVKLKNPVLPGAKTEISLNFKTYFDQGGVRRRMKMFNRWGVNHYDGVHWYPRICVYDRKFGWETDQHLGKEFYGDFGCYDVELTLPQQYVLDATGELQNRTQVLPDELRKKLDVSNFKDKKLGSKPSVITPYEKGKFKTWIYHAENVHDFAWTADPTYRIGEAEWNGIKCIALAQEPNASKWQESAKYTAWIIKTYSEDFGMYAYHKMIVADAQDGMEYPMLTLDGGFYPQHQGLLAHEVGHNWFFGMVGNNETYRAMLDEGFTQFLTSWCMSKSYIKNKKDVISERDEDLPEVKNKELQKDTLSDKDIDEKVRFERIYNPYLSSVIERYDEPLNTHSDAFNGATGHDGGYRLVYYKTATMLYNLRYVLGDELFLKAMKDYFNTWKIAHPYPEDFRNSIIHSTGVDLNWFFDQWIETTKYIDYGIKNYHKTGNPGEYEIIFKRKGRMQMPIDFSVTDKKGKVHNYHIPNTWFVKKSNDPNTTVLPKWFGWDRLNPVHSATVTIPDGIQNIEIDREHFLADIDRRDNTWLDAYKRKWDLKKFEPPDWLHKRRNYRPELWYNAIDGLQPGIHVNGNYFEEYSNVSMTLWYNSNILNRKIQEELKNNKEIFSYNFHFRTHLNQYWKNSSVTLQSSSYSELIKNSVKLEKKFTSQDSWDENNHLIYLQLKSMYKPNREGLEYLVYSDTLLKRDFWTTEVFNNSVNIGWIKSYSRIKNSGSWNFSLRLPGFIFTEKSESYSWINMSQINTSKLGDFELRSRFFAQYGAGIFPGESKLFIAGANPEDLSENKYTRARGFFPDEWAEYGAGTNHFQMGGGLNLRGYAGYVAPQEGTNEEIIFTYQGQSGAGVNLELGFERIFQTPVKRRWFYMDMYLFGDGGSMVYRDSKENQHFSNIRVDAGIGTALQIRIPDRNIAPLIIRFDVPLFLNNPPAKDNFVAYRWVVGINRAF
ncbi:MAG: hypothetical protein A3G23_08120 [Bacteroidetes bacterium RIFCSPLOWO2_12_FULL_37_12]|nr:MAG: hypothetical protein A3G23_08120 [Bacteroidetes bacterium RIFCSPLOWO2_12_FULL_37_12]